MQNESNELVLKSYGISIAPLGLGVEFHFHTQQEVSLFVEHTAVDESVQKFGELLFMITYAFRQASNLGPGELGRSIGSALTAMVRTEEWDCSTMLSVVPYGGVPGRKRFECVLTFDAQKMLNLKLRPRGFGFMAKGMGYYAPISVVALVVFLAKRRDTDKAFLRILRSVVASAATTIATENISPLNCLKLSLEAFSIGVEITKNLDESATNHGL